MKGFYHMNKTRVLMCCSELSVKGGMVSVVKNYLAYDNWEDYEIVYVPTHTEKCKIVVALYFAVAYVRILFLAAFGHIAIAHLHTSERGSVYRKSILVRTLHRFGIKTILHHHGAEFDSFYSNLSDKKKKYVSGTLSLADINIVLSKRLVSMIKEKAPGARVEVLYNAVNTYPRNPYNTQSTCALFLGRLGERKGTYDLLTAIKLLDGELPAKVRFFLCGDGDIDGVRRRIEELHIEHRIAYVGWIDGEEKRKVMNQSAVNILPSYHEGLPMTILETMAYGIPNISTSIASVPEVIRDGENGFLLEPGDVQGLADSIRKLFADDSLRMKMSENAYGFVTEQFALSQHVGKLVGLYRELAKGL